MRFAFVTEAVPNPGVSGGDAVSWAIIKCTVEAGHEMVCCCLINQWARQQPEAVERYLLALTDWGVRVEPLMIPTSGLTTLSQQNDQKGTWQRQVERLRNSLYPAVAKLYPSVTLAPRLRDILERTRPDAILVFDTGTVAALQHLRIAPRMAIPGDPPHLVQQYRRRFHKAPVRLDPSYILGVFADVIAAKRLPRLINQMLRQYESVGFFGAQHAAWVQANGIECLYLRPPVADTAGTQWQELRDACPLRSKPKILILGHLSGTASLTGLDSFAEKTLPSLERRLGPNGFELHLVGRGSLSQGLQKKLARPSVRLRGYVEDVTSEFLSADVFLSATPYPVGVRTRIVEAFSYGCCVVTHHFSALGLPELLDGENVLLAAEGVGWADAIVRALNDSSLRKKVGENARRTYEQFFAPAVAGGRIVAELKRIALERNLQMESLSRGSLHLP
jgi:glycosyltransferase involved in cell wall biosynthesis